MYIEEVELRPVGIVEGRGDFKAILHWSHQPYVLTISQAFRVADFAQHQSKAQWVEIKKGGIQQFYEEALVDEPLEVYISDRSALKSPAVLSIEQAELQALAIKRIKRKSDVKVIQRGEAQKKQKREDKESSSALTMEQEEFLQKLPSESRGSVRKVLSKAVGEDIWSTIKKANWDELIQIPGIKE